jgi:signal transduction histidine kinase/PAS domain-containing protein/ActR/RegA family two-component response regulator
MGMTSAEKIPLDGSEALDLLRDAIESLSEGFALYDEDRHLVMCNQRYKDMNSAVADLLEPGLDWEILMRETARRGVYSDAIGREEAWIRDRLETTHDYVDEFELEHTDGNHYLVSTHPTKLGGFVVTRTDITERKRAEFIEREGDLLVRTVLDASSAVVIMARTGDGRILYRSPAAHEMFGSTKSAREHYSNPDDRADFVTEMLADGLVDNYRLDVLAKGKLFPASISARFAEFRGEEVIVTSVIDLTEEMKSQQLVKQVLEACPVPIQMTRAETGDLLFTSLQSSDNDSVKTSHRSFFNDKDVRPKFLAALRKQDWVKDFKAEFVDPHGRVFWGAISAQLIEFNGEEVIVSSTRDLTEEQALQAELATQQEMLFQNEKMSALGELLAGVAHELNNPLSIVVGHSLMLREETHEPDTLRRIDKISNAAERSAKIVKTFLAMARQQPTKMEPVDLKSIITTSVDVAGYGKSQDGLEIVCDLPADLPEITADGDQITQVVINLIMNSQQAITQSSIGNLIKVQARLGRRKDSVKIVIKDNGPGVPDNIGGRIFEPFFTTKEVGDGTGIGLAFCHRIIHSHGGKIWLDQSYTKGSKFCITLPVAAPHAEEDPLEPLRRSAAEARRILVVDDETDVGDFIAEVLRKEGFDIDVAQSGRDAFDFLENNAYDAVLSDLNMPGVDGRGLYERLSNDFKELAQRTAFITGDTMGETSQKLLQSSKRPYLEKPVSPNEVRKLVYDLLSDVKEDS